jgi:hypothetical protein
LKPPQEIPIIPIAEHQHCERNPADDLEGVFDLLPVILVKEDALGVSGAPEVDANDA